MTDLTFQHWLGIFLCCFGVVLFLFVIMKAPEKHINDRMRRDPVWFSDQHREERKERVRTWQESAAKGFKKPQVDLEESKARAHLQAVSKTGDSRS